MWDGLIPARAGYFAHMSPPYDEVLHQVAHRTEHTGSLSRTDIAALTVWKRLTAQTRWATDLMSLPDSHVRAVTHRAVSAVRATALTRSQAARQAYRIIAQLPGLRTGDGLASSAVLTAAAQTRMAVCDRRVQHAVTTLRRTLAPATGRYGLCLQLLDGLLHPVPPHADAFSARDVDAALYRLSNNSNTMLNLITLPEHDRALPGLRVPRSACRPEDPDLRPGP